MKINKKVTDFIILDEGNIGRKSAVVTGALLASSVLGLVLTTQVAEAACWQDIHNEGHNEGWDHNEYYKDIPAC